MGVMARMGCRRAYPDGTRGAPWHSCAAKDRRRQGAPSSSPRFPPGRRDRLQSASAGGRASSGLRPVGVASVPTEASRGVGAAAAVLTRTAAAPRRDAASFDRGPRCWDPRRGASCVRTPTRGRSRPRPRLRAAARSRRPRAAAAEMDHHEVPDAGHAAPSACGGKLGPPAREKPGAAANPEATPLWKDPGPHPLPRPVWPARARSARQLSVTVVAPVARARAQSRAAAAAARPRGLPLGR